jgi:hypothetical protein
VPVFHRLPLVLSISYIGLYADQSSSRSGLLCRAVTEITATAGPGALLPLHQSCGEADIRAVAGVVGLPVVAQAYHIENVATLSR